MNKLSRREIIISSVLMSCFCASGARGEVAKKSDKKQNDEPTEEEMKNGITALTQAVRHGKGEAYLVCCYNAVAQPHGIARMAEFGYMELRLKVTVIDVLKGHAIRGSKIDLIRYSGKKEEADTDVKEILGSLFFMFSEPLDNGNFLVDPQDPCSVLTYSEDRQKILTEYFKGGGK